MRFDLGEERTSKVKAFDKMIYLNLFNQVKFSF